MDDEFTITEKEVAEMFAKSWNLLSVEPLEPIINELTVYESQMVLTPMVGKDEILDYLEAKFKVLSDNPANRPYLEIGRLQGFRPCVIMYQGSKNNPICLALFKVEGRLIKRIDLCIVPSPYEAERTGIFPGMS